MVLRQFSCQIYLKAKVKPMLGLWYGLNKFHWPLIIERNNLIYVYELNTYNYSKRKKGFSKYYPCRHIKKATLPIKKWIILYNVIGKVQWCETSYQMYETFTSINNKHLRFRFMRNKGTKWCTNNNVPRATISICIKECQSLRTDVPIVREFIQIYPLVASSCCLTIWATSL